MSAPTTDLVWSYTGVSLLAVYLTLCTYLLVVHDQVSQQFLHNFAQETWYSEFKGLPAKV